LSGAEWISSVAALMVSSTSVKLYWPLSSMRTFDANSPLTAERAAVRTSGVLRLP